jgi:hypothetical protein
VIPSEQELVMATSEVSTYQNMHIAGMLAMDAGPVGAAWSDGQSENGSDTDGSNATHPTGARNAPVGCNAPPGHEYVVDWALPAGANAKPAESINHKAEPAGDAPPAPPGGRSSPAGLVCYPKADV